MGSYEEDSADMMTTIYDDEDGRLYGSRVDKYDYDGEYESLKTVDEMGSILGALGRGIKAVVTIISKN